MNSEKNLKQLIQEQLEFKGLSLLRLQQITNIPERYLEALIKGELHKMPPAPYARGYLMKIAEILNLNGEELWRQYKEETEIKSSGPTDRLPQNRFAIKSFRKRWFVAALIAAALLIYLIINAGRLLGQPPLTINFPLSEISVTESLIVTLTGKINPSDILKINKQEIPVDSTGKFEKTYNLQPGLNSFEFSVKRFLGKETTAVRQIIYQPSPSL